MADRIQWSNSNVLVTGGASFIGSHLVDALVELGAAVRIVDDLSSGSLANLSMPLDAGQIEFVEGDLRDAVIAQMAVADMDLVFHLAADHGGRGYIDRHPVECAGNLILDGCVFRACAEQGVRKVVYASSACVYPLSLQADPREEIFLAESMVGPPYDPDGMYGWSKLTGERTLAEYARCTDIQAVSCRYFTAYGERCSETHALIAMIARAFITQDPFLVWGDGEQIRNWTHVLDIVDGTLRAAECICDGSAINVGTSDRIRVIDAAREVLNYSGHQAPIELQPDMPVGPRNRVGDGRRARELLDWQPRTTFIDGIHRTIDWYYGAKDREVIRTSLEDRLLERRVEAHGTRQRK